MLAATAKYPSVLATSARLQIFASKTSFLQVHIFVLYFQWWESAHLQIFTAKHCFLQVHIFVLSPVGDSASWLSCVQQGVTESTDAAEVLSLLLAEYRLKGGAHTQKTKVRGLIKYIQSSKSG